MALSTAQTRRAWSAYRCNRKGWKEITFLNRRPVRIIDVLEDAWSAAEQALLATGYGNAKIVGSYACRNVRDSAYASLHAYRLAVDVDPALNGRKRYGTTRRKWWEWSKITRLQVNAVTAIRTRNGKRVFTHGGTFRSQDPMHFQIACTPADIRSGIDWSTVKGHASKQTAPGAAATGKGGTGPRPVLRKQPRPSKVPSSHKAATGTLQAALNAEGAKLKVDGLFGPRTNEAVRAYQKRHRLTVDGIVGKHTWAKIDG